MARHLRGQLSAEQLAHINRRHITAEKLDAALRDVIDRFDRFTLPRYWGDEKRAAADGTQYELAEENLLAEKHIRYGGYGGIAYHHVSDLYILLFSHFIAVRCLGGDLHPGWTDAQPFCYPARYYPRRYAGAEPACFWTLLFVRHEAHAAHPQLERPEVLSTNQRHGV